MSTRIVCFGAGPAFKGGMSNYNTSLARALDHNPDVEVEIVSWSQQYPSIVPREFRDLRSKQDFLEGTDIKCRYLTNYNRPGTWSATAKYIASLQPAMVIIQWSIAIQGLPIGHIIRRLKRLSACEIIVDLHFVVQKEQSRIDKICTKYGISRADTYIVHALRTYEELRALFPQQEFSLTRSGRRAAEGESTKAVLQLFHPIYDLYAPDPSFDVQAFREAHGLKEKVFLFFGFIRKYKGLHNAIRSFHKVSQERENISLLICGESFWKTLDADSRVTKTKRLLFKIAKRLLLGSGEDEGDYRPLALVDELGVKDVVVFNEFIPNEDVHKYFQSSDFVVLFYEYATPSGIESLSYNFGLPILATDVGHFPETISDGENGYLAERDNVDSMAAAMIRMLDFPVSRENVQEVSQSLSWKAYASAILNAEDVPSASDPQTVTAE